MASADIKGDPLRLADDHRACLDRFRQLLAGLANTSRGGALLDLERAWAAARPFGLATWRTVRGPYGETVLHWIMFLKAIKTRMDNSLVETCVKLAIDILNAVPELASVACNREPYQGCTVLHQACADGDVAFVRCLTEVPLASRPDLDVRMQTSLVHTFKRPAVVDKLKQQSTSQKDDSSIMESPLEVAALVVEDDKKSMEIVKILLEAGAKALFIGASGEVEYTFLHLVARGRWQGDGPFDMSENRTKLLVALLMGPPPIGGGCLVDPSIKNNSGMTALQVAASLGNEIMFVEMLDRMKRPTWVWGNTRAVTFPIDEIDSAADENENGALELMVLYRRTNLLDLGLVDALIHHKWKHFGRRLFLAMLTFELMVLVSSAIYCLDTTKGWSPLRWYCRCFVIFASSFYLLAVVFLFFKNGAFRDSWVRSLSWRPMDEVTLSVWSLMVVRQCCEFLVMILLGFSSPHRYSGWDGESHSRQYTYAWHFCTSIWWLLLSTHVMSYFMLFESTAGLAVAVPRILYKDMLPFSLVFMTMLFFTAVALRIAVSHMVGDADPIVGSFWKTFLTLEESIHGPDVRWRTLVEGRTEDMIIDSDHPDSYNFLPGFIFVGFLWLSLMMMSIILALFSARYDELRSSNHVKSMFKLTQATFTMVAEKLMPDPEDSSSLLLSKEGYGATGFAAQLNGTVDAKKSSPAEAASGIRGAPVVTRSKHWFLWLSGSGSHNDWREPQLELGDGAS